MAILEEILKLDSIIQVSDPKKSKTVAPRVLTAVAPIGHNNIARPQPRLLMGCGRSPRWALRGGLIVAALQLVGKDRTE